MYKKNISKRPPLFARIVMVLLLISPILQCYGWGKFDFSFIIMSFLSVYHLMLHGIKNTKVPRSLFCYFGWWYFSHLLSSSFVSEFIPLGLIKIVITYIMYIDLFDLDYFMSKYKRIASFVIVYFYIQEIGRIVVGIHLPSVVPFIPIAVTDNAQEYIQSSIESLRSCSLFKEPAVFAQYLLPLLCYEMFSKSNNRSWKKIILLSITLLWSRAGNGMIGLMVLAACYGFDVLKNQRGVKKFGYFFLGLLFAVSCLTVFMETEGGKKVLNRATNLNLESTLEQGYAGSTFMRIYQGYYIFYEFSDFYKVIGNDHDSYIQQKAFNSPEMSYLYRNADFVTYFNSFQNVLIYTGFIGMFLISLFFRGVWKGNSYCGKSMLLVLFALSLISANYFTQVMALFLLPVMGMKEDSIKKLQHNE